MTYQYKNPKSEIEIRRPKEIRNPNRPNSKADGFGFWPSGFPSAFGFRISDFRPDTLPVFTPKCT
jgi:hypothetical protein